MTERVQGFTPTRLSPAELDIRIQQGQVTSKPQEAGNSFADVLQTQVNEPLRFSSHAQERLRSRSIQLTEQDTIELNKAVEMAGAKGAQESLIMIDDLALIVSVKNKVVITALERGQQGEASVFTHIDSAVVLPRSRG